MSNTITAYFKGRTGVAESVYQNDYGIVMEFDEISLPAHFDCYFSVPGSDTATAAVGADNRVAIPNSVLGNSGNMSVHIPLHTGENDSEVEYVAYFKVIGRARPEDDGTPTQMTAIEQALALLQNPITNIEQIVNEALAFTGETFEEMQEDLDEWKTDTEEGLETWKGGVESDFDNLEAQFDTAVAAVTTDTEVTNIRVGADGVTDTTAGASVRRQFTNVKDALTNIDDCIWDYKFENLNDVSWTQGLITSDGSISPSNLNIYSDFLPNNVDFISLLNGYRASLVKYTSGETFVERTQFDLTGIVPIDRADGYKYRVQLAIIPNTNILPSDSVNVLFGSFDSINSAWRYGNIDSSGNVVSGLGNLHTADYIDPNVTEVMPNNGYRIAVARYKLDGTFIERAAYTTSKVYLFPDQNKYKIAVAHAPSDANFLPKEADALVVYNPESTEKENVAESIESLRTITGKYSDIGMWEYGMIRPDGSLTQSRSAMHTTDFLPSNIIGIETDDTQYRFAVAKYDISDDSFVSREGNHTLKPRFNFDHTNYKYKVSLIRYDDSALERDVTKHIYFYTDTKESNNIMCRQVGISDMSRLLSGDGTQVAYDTEKGIAYVIYNASESVYGEAYRLLEMVTFPIGQPFRPTYYVVASSGETYGDLHFDYIRDCDIYDFGSFVRVYFFEVTTSVMWYRDFNKASKTFGDAYRCYFKPSANEDAVVMNTSALINYYDAHGLSYGADKPVTISCDIVKHDNYYYTVITFGASSYPTFAQSSDGVTWVALNTPTLQLQFEAALAYSDGWYLVCRNNGVYYSDDDFATYTRIGNDANFKQALTRPEIITYGDGVIIGMSQSDVKENDIICNGDRKHITFYKGSGTDINAYKPLFTLFNDNGICYFRLLNVNGIVYLITTLGDLYVSHHESVYGIGCKDGVYIIPLGRM